MRSTVSELKVSIFKQMHKRIQNGPEGFKINSMRKPHSYTRGPDSGLQKELINGTPEWHWHWKTAAVPFGLLFSHLALLYSDKYRKLKKKYANIVSVSLYIYRTELNSKLKKKGKKKKKLFEIIAPYGPVLKEN